MNATLPRSPETLRAALLELLVQVAPDVEPSAVRPGVEFRQQFDFDSMDVFRLAVAVHERFGLDIPEQDYRELLSLDRGVSYLQRRLGASA
jgi:acyl carrier protein